MAEKYAPGSMDIYLNEQRADLELFRMIIQIWMSRMLDMTPQGSEALAAMEDDIGQILGTPIEGHGEVQDLDRFRQLLQMRAEDFFQRLRESKGYPPRKGRTKGVN